MAADVERLIARARRARPRTSACSCARCAPRARRSRSRSRSARCPYHLTGAAAFFQRAEVRDLLAWLRLLVDPGDAGAVVRALARPPVELRAIDLARVTQIARRRKLDMVAALSRRAGVAADPARGARADRHASSSSTAPRRRALDSSRPDLYVHRLIERLGLRRQLLFAATTEVVERLRNLARFAELAAAYVRRAPQATAREFARSIAAVADAGLREEEAAGAERAARRARDDDARRQGPRVRARLRARADERAMPGPRRQTLEPIPDALLKEAVPPLVARRARRRDAAAAARGDDARARSGSCSPTRSAPTAARRSSRRRSPRRRGPRSAASGSRARRSCSGPPRRCSRRSGCCATSC